MLEYRITVDRIDPREWSETLDQFADANLYQTWSYGTVRWGEKNLSHVVLKRGQETVALAQLLVVRPLRLSVGIAHLRWGPVCQRKGADIDPEIVQRMASALHGEYVEKRGLFLRVLPRAWTQSRRGLIFHSTFTHFVQQRFRADESYRTLVVDLTQPLDLIRKRLDQKWRNQLNRAERNGLTIRKGGGPDDFQTFFRLYDQMLTRKRFGSSDVRQFERIQEHLPPSQRMTVVVCEENGVPVAALVGTGIGDTGVYLLGATSDQGMRCKAAYLLQWHTIQWLKNNSVPYYDLGGINPETNPGVYHFKKGLSGDDVLYLNPLTACTSITSKGFAAAVDTLRGNGRRALSRLYGRT